MSRDESRRCEGCGWMYYCDLERPDAGLCGTCSRERGLAYRDEFTDDLDAKVRALQARVRATEATR